MVGVDQPLTVPDDGKKGLSDSMLLRWLPEPCGIARAEEGWDGRNLPGDRGGQRGPRSLPALPGSGPISGRSRGSPHGYRNIRPAVLRVGLASPAGDGGRGQGIADYVRRGHPRAIQPAGAGADGLAGLGGRRLSAGDDGSDGSGWPAQHPRA